VPIATKNGWWNSGEIPEDRSSVAKAVLILLDLCTAKARTIQEIENIVRPSALLTSIRRLKQPDGLGWFSVALMALGVAVAFGPAH